MDEPADDGRVFIIDGGRYGLPDVSSLDMAERRVMYDLAGLVQEDFIREENEDDEEHDARITHLTRHPGFMESLMHIAYQRGHPELKRERVQKVIDHTKFIEAVAEWGDVDEDVEEEEVPLALTNTPGESSPSESSEKPGSSKPSSGETSANGSDEPAVTLALTGTTRLDT